MSASAKVRRPPSSPAPRVAAARPGGGRRAHYGKLENLYHAAPCNAYFQPRIRIGRGTAEVRVPVRPDMFHAANALHGVVYFKALDDAAFFAANSLVPDVFVLTATLDVEFLRPVTGGTLVARGRVLDPGARRIAAASEVRIEGGELVGRASGTFARSRIRLEERLGYR